MGSGANRRDVKKERYWQKTIKEAARSGMSIREFCSRRRLTQGQFYWWQRKMRKHPGGSRASNNMGNEASFALVSEEPGESLQASIELVLKNGSAEPKEAAAWASEGAGQGRSQAALGRTAHGHSAGAA